MKRLTPDSPELKSADLVVENIERLRELFPEAFANEAMIDFDVLRQLLGDRVAAGEERYGLNWHGKRAARQLALTPSTGSLRPCPDESVDWGSTQNIFIEGDNLEVLKLLQKSYAGKVKLIYIDPPYNTGKDFVYPDNFQDSVKNYLEITGQVEGGQKIASNTEASGRFHTDWLNMIYPRLKLSRSLLADSGVVFISIDDNEVASLTTVMNEVYGESNHVATICHKARASVSNDKIISSNHNFILLYAKNIDVLFANRTAFGLAPDLSGFDRTDARGAFKYVPVDGPGGASKGNPHYTFLGVTGYWRFSEERMKRMHAEGLIEKVGSGLQQKYYLEEARQSRKTDTTWWDDKLYTATASSRLKALMGADVFDNPKPVELVQRMLELVVRSEGDLVLDFFAGSGTTGHGVYEQSAKDGVKRRWILVQLPEPLKPEEPGQKVAEKYCRELKRPACISELTKERLRLAANSIRSDSPAIVADLGFQVFKLDSGNVDPWAASRDTLAQALTAAVDHVKVDRSEDDLLYDIILKHGLDLCLPIVERKIGSHKVRAVGGGAVFACFGSRITAADVEHLAEDIAKWRDELAPANPELSRVVFRDSAFESDVAKTNLALILKERGFDEKLVVSL